MYNVFGDFMNKKLKAVILDGYTENPGDLSWDCIGNLTDLTVYDRTPEDLVIERAKDAEILIVNKVKLTEEIIAQLSNLKFVGTLATGYNQIDGVALRKRNIPLSNIPSYSTNAVAQMVFAYILEFVNRVSEYTASVKKGDWENCKDFCYWNMPLFELDGKTLGIIGFGKIGRRVSEIAKAFGMNVLVYTPSGKKDDAPGVEFTDMDVVLKNSDFITVHCPLTDKTAGLINKEFISKLKDGACVINTARGGVANEDDIANAYNNINPDYQSSGFKIVLGEWYSAQVYVGNYTSENKTMAECPIVEIYLPVDLEEDNSILTFAFPLTITEAELIANSGEPTDRSDYTSDDEYESDEYE